MSHRVLVLCRQLQQHLDRYRELLASRGVEVEAPEVVQQMREAELLELIGRFDGVVAGDDEITARVLERGKKLKVVAKWGVGLDAIDREAAARLGIQVRNTPDVFADEVADVVLGYIVLLARRLHQLDRSVREGGWLKVQGRSLRGRRLGVVGVGSIGRAVVRRGRAVGMEVQGHDVVPVADEFVSETGMRQVTLDELLATSAFISLNCPLTPDNRHLLDGAAFAKVRRGASLINTARGPLVDERALVSALEDGTLSGAALDVFEEEPLPPQSPLRRFDNVILGTHNASNTRDAVLRVNELVLDNLFRGLGLDG